VPVTGRVLLAGGGARSTAVRQVMADLCDLPVATVDADEAAAAGACVQAASVLTGRPAGEVAAAWGLGQGHPVARSGAASSAAAVRAAYAVLRGRLYP
jgi:xylulokinase